MSRPSALSPWLIPALLVALWTGLGIAQAQMPEHRPPPPGFPPPPGERPPPAFPPPPPPPPPPPAPMPLPASAPATITTSVTAADATPRDNALDDARAAVATARGDSGGGALAPALLHLAALLEQRGRSNETLPLLQEVVAIAEGAQDERLAQQAALQLASAHAALGNTEQAAVWRQRADGYRDRFSRRLLGSDNGPDTATRPVTAITTPVQANAPAATALPAPTRESRPLWPWLVASLCIALLVAWARTRRRAAELEQEAAHLQRRQHHAHSLNAKLQAESEQLRRQAVQDTLTGALTRHAFAASLKDLLTHASHYGRPVALLVMDLDHFKSINDEFGHLSGDAALKLVVGIAREQLRSGDLLGRFGGDEFLVAVIDHDVSTAVALGDAIRRSVAQRAGATQALARLRVSIGIAHATPASGYDLEPLFQRADAALYAAKRTGRDRVAVEGGDGDASPATPSLRQLTAPSVEGESASGAPIH